MGDNVITWDESMSVGIRAMDAQHRLILGQVNRLGRCMAAGCGRTSMSGVISRLVVFATEHFRAEEAMLKLIGYPELEEHHAGHSAFKLQMMRFDNAFAAQVSGVEELLLEYLRDWWTDHIIVEDMKYKGLVSGDQGEHTQMKKLQVRS